MGRGYSQTRSRTSRATRDQKRGRSVSLAKLKRSIENSVSAHKDGVNRSMTAHKSQIKKIDEEDPYATEDDEQTVRNPPVMTKYAHCGNMVDQTVREVMSICVPGANTYDLCIEGDRLLKEKLQKSYRKAKEEETGKPINKGIAYPTSVSVNECVANHSPSDKGHRLVVTLKAGDVVKVHMAAHLDGYVVTAAQTLVVGIPPPFETPKVQTGNDEDGAAPAADAVDVSVLPPAALRAIAGAYTAIHALIRKIGEPDVTNEACTNMLHGIARIYRTNPLEGVISHRTKRWVADACDGLIIQRRVVETEPQQDVADCIVKPNQVWTLDVAFTSAGCEVETDAETAQDTPAQVKEKQKWKGVEFRLKPEQEDAGCVGIFRRNEIEAPLRLNTAIEILDEVRLSYGCIPFHIRNLNDPKKARLGLTEIKKNFMVDAYPPLYGMPGSITARFSCTVAIGESHHISVLGGLPVIPGAILTAAENSLKNSKQYGHSSPIPKWLTNLLEMPINRAARKKLVVKRDAVVSRGDVTRTEKVVKDDVDDDEIEARATKVRRAE